VKMPDWVNQRRKRTTTALGEKRERLEEKSTRLTQNEYRLKFTSSKNRDVHDTRNREEFNAPIYNPSSN